MFETYFVNRARAGVTTPRVRYERAAVDLSCRWPSTLVPAGAQIGNSGVMTDKRYRVGARHSAVTERLRGPSDPRRSDPKSQAG
jgi:hypothetical protein